MRGVTGVDKFTVPTGEQLLVELGIFAVPGAARVGTQLAARQLDRAAPAAPSEAAPPQAEVSDVVADMERLLAQPPMPEAQAISDGTPPATPEATQAPQPESTPAQEAQARQTTIEAIAGELLQKSPVAAAELAKKNKPSRGDLQKALGAQKDADALEDVPSWSPDDAQAFHRLIPKAADRALLAEALRNLQEEPQAPPPIQPEVQEPPNAQIEPPTDRGREVAQRPVEPSREVAPEVAQQPPAEEARAVEKQPWEMTEQEFVEVHDAFPQTRRLAMDGADLVAAIDWIREHKGNASLSDVLGPAGSIKEFRALHVAKAMMEDKPVPPEVLADYPDLAKPEPAVEQPPAYEAMTGKQLRARAKELGLKGVGGLKKAAVVERIKAAEAGDLPAHAGARPRPKKQGQAKVDAAKEHLRTILANKDLVGKQRADAFANGKELVQFLQANAHLELETDYFRGDQIAYTGEVSDDGLRKFIYLEGARAGAYGENTTVAERESRQKTDRDADRRQQEGFKRLREQPEQPADKWQEEQAWLAEQEGAKEPTRPPTAELAAIKAEQEAKGELEKQPPPEPPAPAVEQAKGWTRDAFKAKLSQAFPKLKADHADAVVAMAEARAAAQGMPLDKWLDTYIADIRVAEQAPKKLGPTTAAFIRKLRSDGRIVLTAIKTKPTLSTLVHEVGHIFRQTLDEALLPQVETWVATHPGAKAAGGKWNRAAEEVFAEGFETWVRSPQAAKSVPATVQEAFGKLRDWLVAMFKSVTPGGGSKVRPQMTPEVASAFEAMMGAQEAVQAKPKGGLMQTPTTKPTGATYDYEGMAKDMERAELAKLGEKAAKRRQHAAGEASETEAQHPDPNSPAYGADNRFVTKDDYQKALDDLGKKAGRLHTGVPVDAIPPLFKVGMYHLEAGARTFADWSTRMTEAVGAKVEPQLEDLWQRCKGVYDETVGSRDTAELLDTYHANRDEMMMEAQIDAQNMQERIQAIMGVKRYGKIAQRADMAIQLHIDLRNAEERGFGTAEEQFAKWGEKLTDDQKALYAESQALSEDLQSVAEDIVAMNAKAGKHAQDADVLKTAYDNYTMRLWKPTKKDAAISAGGKFSTTTGRAKRRTYESMLEGWTDGRELQVKGATTAMETARTEVAQVVEDRALIEEGMAAGLISKIPEEGMKPINHPNFTTPAWAGHVEEGKIYAKDIRIDKEGNVWKRVPLYAKADLAKKLNNILGKSTLYDWFPGVATATKWNAMLKNQILFTSLFHHQAYLRSYMLGSAARGWEMSPRQAFKEGMKAIKAFEAELRALVRGGLTLGRIMDWDETQWEQQETLIGKAIDKVGGGAAREQILEWRRAQTDFLFKKLGAALKAQAALLEYRRALTRHRAELDAGTMTSHDIAKRVADLINDDFGGLHLGRMGRSPTLQHAFRLLALAPDWTESNVRSMVKAFKPGPEGAMFRRFWGRILLRGMGTTVAANMALALWKDDDDDEKTWARRFAKRYRYAWQAGRFRWLGVDVTPIARALGANPKERKYFSLIGHFGDPLKFAFHPVRSAKHKGSVIVRPLHALVSGKDWAGRNFTTLMELLGVDDKGVYATSRKGHYKKGQPKGGKMRGKTVAWKFGGGPVEYEQLPSFALNQARSVLPIPMQEAIAYFHGECDGFDALSKSFGFHTARAKEPAVRRVQSLADIKKQYQRWKDTGK